MTHQNLKSLNVLETVLSHLKRFADVGFPQNIRYICFSQSRLNFKELEHDDIVEAFECDVF